jgi:deoxyadenosine/deoxycytidine kinase
LNRLNIRYDQWAQRFRRCPLLRVETDRLDVVRSGTDLEQVVTEIEEALRRQESHSLFDP